MKLLIECTTEYQDKLINQFTEFAYMKLGIYDNPLTIFKPVTGTTSFGSYQPSTGMVIVATEGRHTSDVLRTLAHELVHHKQLSEGENLKTVEELEWEANAVAGMLMRDFNKLHPEMFGLSAAVEPPTDTLGDSQGATFPDPTRPSGPIEMAEEMGVGGGAIAGVGIGPQGEPGVSPKKRKSPIMGPMRVRKTLGSLGLPNTNLASVLRGKKTFKQLKEELS